MPANAGADRLLPGLVLPSIALSSTDGETISLAALPGRSLLIVYPWTGRPGHPNPPHWDDIPGAHGSTPELEGFRDSHADFMRLGLNLFGLSRQTTAYQRELVERLELPFPILSDADGCFSAALGLPCFTAGGRIYLTRLTLVLDGGTIDTALHPVSDPVGHANEVLRWLEARR